MKIRLPLRPKKMAIWGSPRQVYCFFSIIVLLAVATFSWWLMSYTFWWRDGQFEMRSYLWSDFAAHLPLIRSFSFGSNWPPEYPQFANEPIRYHFLFYLLVGLLEKSGMSLGWALNLPSALGLTGMLFLIYLLAGELFESAQNNLNGGRVVWGKIVAGLLAVWLVLFNGSLTYIDYFQKNGFTLDAWSKIFKQEEFLNFGPWNGDSISAFWHWNIYTNQRHLALSFAMVLLMILVLIKAQRSTDHSARQRVKVGLIIAWGFLLLPFVNYASFGIAGLLLVGWLLINARSAKYYWLPVILGMSCALPGVIYFGSMGRQIAFNPGFLTPTKQFGAFLYYWWRNMGLYLPLWPVLLIAHRGLMRRWLLLMSALFVIANLFQLSPDIINNHKLINFFQIGLVVALSIKMSEWWFVKSRFTGFIYRVLILLFVIPLTLSGWLDASAIVHDSLITAEDPIATKQGQWLMRLVPPESVVVTNQYIYNPINLIGRKTYLDYGYFAWSMGYQDYDRREKLKAIFAKDTNRQKWCQLIQSEQIDYIYLIPGSGDLKEYRLESSWVLTQNKPSLNDAAGNSLYSVKLICSDSQQSL